MSGRNNGHRDRGPSPEAEVLPVSMDAALQRRFRRALGGGVALPPRLRAWLEAGLGSDLRPLRVHADAEADRLASALGADAVTVGADVFFRAGRYAPERGAGRRLLVHEVVHAGQQAALGPELLARCPAAGWELAADRVAAALVDGARRSAGPVRAVRRLREDEPILAQCHASWEHRLLGDARPADLAAIAKSKTSAFSTKMLEDLAAFYLMWSERPEEVTEAQITKNFPYIRTLRLTASRLLVTYGELNTLPDYLANPAVMDDQPAGVLLPILQAIRQEGYVNARKLLKKAGLVPFKDAVSVGTGCKMFDQLYQVRKLDELTRNLGPNGTDHYTALLARNACHFAPFTWYRWETHHTIARDLAGRARRATNPDERAECTHRAWLHHGYADHFLQDSFASGHLINKTVVMQWFVEWAGEQTWVKITDWPQIMRMSTLRQPGLSAPGLYDSANPGTGRDPQTAEEQSGRDERIRLSGVTADLLVDQNEAYRNYLDFLNSTVVQSSAAALHDHYSTQSLWVSSVADTTPYEVWGDDTMLTGGDGVRIAAETAQMSQQALRELLTIGTTGITIQQIRNRFPTMVGETGHTRTLPEWHTDIREKVLNDIFPKIHYNLLLAMPHIGRVSVDL